MKNIILSLILSVVNLKDSDAIHRQYKELKKENKLSIKKEDLPEEFSENALKTVNDFIQKTYSLNHEWVIYFDYTTGEILKCGHGGNNNVNITFKEDEFENYNVASIHNHPKDLLSAPSYKNFRIFERKFEDYELIAGYEHFWILKAKGLYENLVDETNNTSEILALTSFITCSIRYRDDEIINNA